MYSGQDNSGLQPVISPQQPIVSGGDTVVVLSPDVEKPKRWPIVVVAVILILVAIGAIVSALLLTRSDVVTGDEVDAYIEYFVYGTEGGKNQISDETFVIDPENYAIVTKMQSSSSEESSEYFNKLYSKFRMVESKGEKKMDADLLRYNEIYLEYYKTTMQTLNSDFLLKAYNKNENLKNLYSDLVVESTGLSRVTYDTLESYAKEQYNFYASVKKIGCLIDGEIDNNCIWENNGDYWRSSIKSVTVDNLNRYNGLVYNLLISNLKKIYEQGGRDE